MNRTDVINALIVKNNYKSYLEIGLDNPNNNYNNIKCDLKECVDPFIIDHHKNGFDVNVTEEFLKSIETILTYRMTSDDFFEQNNKTYDIVFIDGMHTKEQVSKDIINSLKVLNTGGKIVVHDCLPAFEEAQIVPRIQAHWNGDVWKTIPELKKQNIKYNTVNTDEGICIIDFMENKQDLKYVESWEFEWKDFEKNKSELMNVVSEDDFRNIYL